MILLVVLFSHHAVAESISTIKTPRGSKVSYATIINPEAKANIILFAGSSGKLKFPKPESSNQKWKGTNNFLIKVRSDFATNGFNVISIDAPSDKQSKNGMKDGSFRHSDDHVSDVDEIIKAIKSNNNLPVWLIGTSRGTESVANVAVNTKEGISGAVFTASMTNGDMDGWDVADFDLEKIKFPVLFVHHEKDGCKVTRPHEVSSLAKKVTNSSNVEVKMVSGGSQKGDPCKPFSHHGFFGIEDQVVKYISDFIKKNSPSGS
jgi:hypothetical protein